MVNPRRRGMGLGFIAEKEPMPVVSGNTVPMGQRRDPGTEGGFQDGRYRPQAEPEEDTDFATPEDEAPEEGDGWSDEARDFRDEVEANTESGDLYEGVDAWKKKWLARAEEMGIDPDEAMRVLDSIADLDQPQE